MKLVSDIMHKNIVGISSAASLGSALKLMRSANVSSLPVLNGRRLAGVLTKDVAEQNDSKDAIKSVRLKKVYLLESDSINKAAKVMEENVLSRIPVVKDGLSMQCTGMITATEIARRIKKKIL